MRADPEPRQIAQQNIYVIGSYRASFARENESE
jgi:hypothetical protein